MSDITRFLEFYASLAVDGETPLIVRQKPLRPLAYHADGNPKCTYIAMLPGARIDPSWSVYGNTGSFIIDRFPEGRPVAQARCVDYPLVLMMDDLGTKAPMPTLPRRGSSSRHLAPIRPAMRSASMTCRPKRSSLRWSARSPTKG
jgi:hypothetical protein